PASMKGEVRHFFAHLLEKNVSVVTLLDADFTFVDKYMAAVYRLPDAKTLRLKDGFRRVTLDEEDRRGGGFLGWQLSSQ
ncbi:DUF1592 domain-containing protein, partial [Akkermansiaceae bacterium]|nr:DUF1592 domain-containing protein [Akkermansiaceae bacterium]